MINIKIYLQNGAKPPEYQTTGSSGADIHAFIREPLTLHPGERALVPTGIHLEIPEGIEAQIRPRSGLAINNGITLLNSPGTIDSDFRGEIKIILINLGQENFTMHSGMRIAQIVFNQTNRAHFIPSDTLGHTERNHGGFGHSGL